MHTFLIIIICFILINYISDSRPSGRGSLSQLRAGRPQGLQPQGGQGRGLGPQAGHPSARHHQREQHRPREGHRAHTQVGAVL